MVGNTYRRIAAALKPYAIVLAAQVALVGTAYLIRNVLGLKIAIVAAILQLLYFLLLLAAAWMGYGPGLLVWGLTFLVVPQVLGTARQGRRDPVVVVLVLLVSVLISWIGRSRRRREAQLVRTAADLETTVRRRTEEARDAGSVAREAEERLRFVLDAAAIGHWDIDLATGEVTRSRRHDELFGHTEPLPRWTREIFQEHVHPQDRDMVEASYRELIEDGSSAAEFRVVWPDRSVHWLWIHGRTHLNEAGRPAHASGVIVDTTDRKRTEEDLRERAQLLNLAYDAILSMDQNGVILFWNQRAEEMYGWSRSEALGNVSHSLLQTEFPAPLAEIERHVQEEGHWEGELLHRRKDGSQIRVSSRWAARRDAGGTPVGFLEINTDITEKRRIEEQLRHTQKLESLGVLAGGVAHDFNNLLTGILGNASLALESLSPQNPDRLLIEEVMKAAERASDLTRQLLAYAGKGRFVMRTIDLSMLVREISGLVQTSVPKVVQLRLNLADPLPGIDADPGQLQQIVMNLVINGAEAIGPEGGTVLVRTSAQPVDAQYIATFDGSGGALRPGEYVCLEVHDTGSGMSGDTLGKIFDPFFTTKFAGRGLGLSAVLGIVNAHKGALKVYSEPGKGTTFKVLFPVSARSLEAPRNSSVGDLAGSGLVLVVDDEEVVRQTARVTLERYGYAVLCAADGASALELFGLRAREISTVILDLTMPGMGGEEVLRRMRAINPTLRVLLSSGYNEVEAVQRFAGAGLAGFIQKPYTAAALAEKVKVVTQQQAGRGQAALR